jgi:hypothetical protein
MLRKAKCVRETIRAIEASTDTPELINLKSFTAAKQPSRHPGTVSHAG